MSNQTPGQDAAAEARAACNNLSREEKGELQLKALRYIETAGIAIKEREMIRAQLHRAIRIADELLGKLPYCRCPIEGSFRCRCGLRQLTGELRELKSEVG